MPVSVTMPRLGESVTEGTVTRWLKQEGDQVTADEPLLEVSTDKVDTEVPSPASGILTSIKVAEDETVEIGVELAVISDAGEAEAGSDQADSDQAGSDQAGSEQAGDGSEHGRVTAADQQPLSSPAGRPRTSRPRSEPAAQAPPADEQTTDEQAPDEPISEAAPEAGSAGPSDQQPASRGQQPAAARPRQPLRPPASCRPSRLRRQQLRPAPPGSPTRLRPRTTRPADSPRPGRRVDDDEVAGTYVTPLVRKLASEHGVDLNSLTGTGVGGRIRKSDVLSAAQDAAEQRAEAEAAAAARPACRRSRPRARLPRPRLPPRRPRSTTPCAARPSSCPGCAR